MAGINKVILIGNLGKDPELRYTPSGQAVCTFSLATSERFTGKDGQKQERTEWHNIVVWAKQGEMCNQYLKKGRTVYLEGRINNRTWDDRDGNKKNRTEIVATTVQFLSPREGGSQGGGGQSAPRAASPELSAPRMDDAGPAPQVQEPTAPPMDDAGPAPAEDDLPF
jgi:single-strand DNA-binding protein